VRCVSSMSCAQMEFGLFVLTACVCSLYLVLKFLLVCPIYFSWQSLYFIWYMPHICLSVFLVGGSFELCSLSCWLFFVFE
jgi:hypothetical protein